MCSRQLGMWTITSTGKQKKKITVLHHINTCWVTATKKQRPRTAHAGPTPSENPPDKNGVMSSLSTPKTGQKLDRASPQGNVFSPTKCINRAKKKRHSSVDIKRAWWILMALFHKSPGVCSEERVFVFDEHLHHLSLVPDVIEGCDGVHVWGPHEGGSKDDGEVLRIHQVEFFILCHPAVRDQSNRLTYSPIAIFAQLFQKALLRPFPADGEAPGWWQCSPLQMRHEVLQGFTVWWRQQSQRFSKSFKLLLRICEFWMDRDRIGAVRTHF